MFDGKSDELDKQLSQVYCAAVFYEMLTAQTTVVEYLF